MGIQKCVGESQQAVREGMGCEVSLGEWVDSVERKDIRNTQCISCTAVSTSSIFIDSSCNNSKGLLFASSFN